MCKLEAFRSLLLEKLSAAAEEIFCAVERMRTQRTLLSAEMSQEQQRAVVHKQLSAVADEIVRILEIMMGEYEAEVSRSHQEKEHQCRHFHRTDCEKDMSSDQQKCEQRRSRSGVQKMPDPPHLKDASTETDSELIGCKPSHFDQRQRTEMGTSTMIQTETQGEHCDVPPCDRKLLSSKNSEAGNEGNSNKEVIETPIKSNKRRSGRKRNRGADCCTMSGRSFQKGFAGKKRKKHQKKIAAASKSQITGQTCRVCGKIFCYRCSFLKHALTHKQTTDLCGACGKHLDSDERLKVHLQTHNEENSYRDQTDDKHSDAESADAASKKEKNNDDWKESEGLCLQKTDSDIQRIKKCEGPKDINLSDLKSSCKACNKSFSCKAGDLCGGCGKHFQTEERLRLHLSQPTSQSCCRVCGKFFRYKRSFLKHVLKHEQSTDLCGVCGKHLDSGEGLKTHLKTHNEENSCRDQTDDKQPEADCSDAESKEGDADEDWEKSEDGDSDKQKTESTPKPKGPKSRDSSNMKHCCKVCGKSFRYRASFLKHVQEDERDTDVCGVCGKHYETKESLRLHLQTHIRTNDCEVCGKHFDSHKQLEMHMRTHTGEKPFVCAICGKAFAQNGNLMGHMRVHTGEKPYICSVCGQSFSFKEYMRAHMRIHTGEKPFLCSFCGKGFRQRGTLKTHMMIHTGESTHRCIVCDKKFYKSGALKIHMRSHTGEKPYLCNVCGKSFTAGGSLTKHMGVHGGEHPHHCSICGKGFLRKDELTRHVQTHGDESTHLTNL